MEGGWKPTGMAVPQALYKAVDRIYINCIIDNLVKSRFKDWIPAPRLREDRLSGYDVSGIYLILISLLSFPRRRESRKWENSTFYETIF